MNNMSQVWSEINKIVTALEPANQSDANRTTDIVNLENYKKCTFIVHTGASAANTPTLTVVTGASSTGATTATAFKYRTMINAVPPLAASDLPGDLTSSTGDGFAITTQKAKGMYIIEVDASTVAAAGTNYDHVALKFTASTSTHATQYYSVLAVLSEPRYPQDILVTAID